MTAADLLARPLIGRARRPRAAAASRIVLGVVCLVVLIGNFGQRRALFGPLSIAAGEPNPGHTPLLWGTSTAVFTGCYLLAILAALVFTVCGGRIVAGVLALLFYEIFVNANPFFTEGGDRLACVVLFCMAFMRTDVHWSATRSLRPERRAPAPDSVSSVLHNAGLSLAVAYLLTIYFWASAWKLDSRPWLKGTALFGILRDRDYQWFAPASLTGHHAVLAVAGWLVIVVQLGLVATSLLGRRGLGHPWFLLAILAMHVGIAVFLNLWDFSMWLIAADVLLIRTDDVTAWRWLLGSRTS